jgi:hypothetical protein
MKVRAAVTVFAIAVSACAPQVRQPERTGISKPSGFPDAYYRDIAARAEPVYGVDPAASLVVIEVRRAGSLARYGHDHVVASHDVQGYVAPDAGRSDLYVPLGRLIVDEPALRAEAGFDTQPSESDIAGTRSNMLKIVLQAADFPFAEIRVSGAPGDAVLRVAVTLHGITHEMPVPAKIDAGSGEIVVSGRLALNQSDFGITPFSILGGAIQVQDRVDLRFRILARRAT